MTLQPALLRFKFDDFASLPSELDSSVYSAEDVACCNGFGWKLKIYPGGQTPLPGYPNDAEEAYIGMFLFKSGRCELNASFGMTFLVRDASGKVRDQQLINPSHYVHVSGEGHGHPNMFKRADIVDYAEKILVDGALLVDVEVRFAPQPDGSYVLPNPLASNMLAFLENAQRADIAFKVDGQKILAHKLILEMNAPVLFSFCGGYNKRSPVPITGVSVLVFQIILRYIYGGNLPGEADVRRWGMTILDAANRFGLVGLKMGVEKIVVDSMIVHGPMLIDWLLFAEAKTCPLIKECAVSLFVLRAKDHLASPRSAKLLKGSPALMQELFVASSDAFDGDARLDGTAQSMSVNDLRKRLHEEGLDVDGSKEMLVARLEASSNKRQRTG